jgi:hypothetical protein
MSTPSKSSDNCRTTASSRLGGSTRSTIVMTQEIGSEDPSPPACCRRQRLRLITLGIVAALILIPEAVWCAPREKAKNPDRPTLPNIMMGVPREDLDAYDSKAEPVAAATGALMSLNQAGWSLIHRYFPTLGSQVQGPEPKLHPEDPDDHRFLAKFANEGPGLSPMPLLCMIWSLPESELSGPLKKMHDELEPTMIVADYSTWDLSQLRKAVNDWTYTTTTSKVVKYRTPKTDRPYKQTSRSNAGITSSIEGLSKAALAFNQALQLFVMTLALVRTETKWESKADPPPPDMVDFTSRMEHQLPLRIRDGETAALFLYLPGISENPFVENEFEERADVIVMKREGETFQIEEFPVYLTADQKEWNPSWIEHNDEINDISLMARKYEHDWTRLDGPYLWFLSDQLNGEDVYRATVNFGTGKIAIEAERYPVRRGAVKRVARPVDYDPQKMTPYEYGVDPPATLPNLLEVEFPSVEEQLASLRRPRAYFSNRFRAWCAYGLWTSGLAADGKTWITVIPDPPRIRPGSSN